MRDGGQAHRARPAANCRLSPPLNAVSHATTCSQANHEMTHRRILSHTARFLRVLVLVPFLLAQFIAAGTMAEAGPDGLRMVLCTGDRTIEVILAADGTIHPAPSDSDHSDQPSPCPWSMLGDRASLAAFAPTPVVTLVAADLQIAPYRVVRLQPARQIRPQPRAPPHRA